MPGAFRIKAFLACAVKAVLALYGKPADEVPGIICDFHKIFTNAMHSVKDCQGNIYGNRG